MNRDLNNEGQEYKTGHIKGRALVVWGGERREQGKVNMVDVFSIQICTWNIETC
jgi:hypothetical protein